MRLFLFLIGGTGSRIMRPLLMQLAAGVHPTDENGQAMPLEIIPIIVDPHQANEDLKRTNNLLRWYKQLRYELYGEATDIVKGFFSVKISSLADILPNGSNLSDSFLFNMSEVESKKFHEYISYSTLDSANQALMSMLFSEEQLETKMDIGFVGSPNIGSVALNEFKDSEEFKQFSNVFQKHDRIFIVSSIFGGTGAAGYPLIVKNIRNAANNPALNNRADLRDAAIGALTVLPYFNVQQDKNSPISRADFISKTKSALYYYHDNLTGLRLQGKDTNRSKVNACYYLGDEIPSNPYFNDPGYNGQRNDAHPIEFVGALSILDFCSIPERQLVSTDGVALNPIYKEYGLARDTKDLTLKDFGLSTRILLNKQMCKWHLAYMYIAHQLGTDIGRGYTEDQPKIAKGFLATGFYKTLTSDFYGGYLIWLRELAQNQRSLKPFNLLASKLSESLNQITPRSGFFKSALDYKNLLAALNKESQHAMKEHRFDSKSAPHKLMTLLDTVLDKLVEEKFDGIV